MSVEDADALAAAISEWLESGNDSGPGHIGRHAEAQDKLLRTVRGDGWNVIDDARKLDSVRKALRRLCDNPTTPEDSGEDMARRQVWSAMGEAP